MTQPQPQPFLPAPAPLNELLPAGWSYPFTRQYRDRGYDSLVHAYVCAVPWSPSASAPYSVTDPLFALLVALTKLGLGPTEFTLDTATDPGRVVVTIAARSFSRAAHRPHPSYDLFTDTAGSITTSVPPGEQWLTLEWPAQINPPSEPSQSEPVEPVTHLLATALIAPLQVGHLLAMLDHAVCDTCRHRLARTRIRHRVSLHTSSADESPDLGCVWPCGHQVLPDGDYCPVSTCPGPSGD